MADGGPLIGVVGSGIAGLRAATAVLKCEIDARIVIFGNEVHRTYNRPGLTKRRYPSSGVPDLVVDGAENDALTWRLGTRVEATDLRTRVLHLSTGETFAYDRLVIASGVRARTSGVSGGCALHAHRTLRGLDDAHYVHGELRARQKVVIAGAGFVACELASLATEYGCDVVMLEARRSGPFESLLGERVAAALGRWVVRHGVTLLTGRSAEELLCRGSADSGPAAPDRPLYVEAIGSVPNVGWLHGNGLDLSDGVRVDERMHVSGYEDVFAAGDIARYPDPWAADRLTRTELWKNAIDTGDLAGRTLASSLGYPSPGHESRKSRVRYLPNMITEMFGLRIQVAGNPRVSDSTEVVHGDPDRPDQGVLVTFLRQNVLVGAAYLDEGARFNGEYIKLVRALKAGS